MPMVDGLLAEFDREMAVTRRMLTVVPLANGDWAPHTKSRGALVGRLDAEFVAPWTLKKDGREMFALPKAAAWRNLMISHLIHHRGQLTVYLRLNDVAVPPSYGPTADEMI